MASSWLMVKISHWGSARSHWRPGYAPSALDQIREDVECRLQSEMECCSAGTRREIPHLKAEPSRLFSSLCLKDGELGPRARSPQSSFKVNIPEIGGRDKFPPHILVLGPVW